MAAKGVAESGVASGGCCRNEYVFPGVNGGGGVIGGWGKESSMATVDFSLVGEGEIGLSWTMLMLNLFELGCKLDTTEYCELETGERSLVSSSLTRAVVEGEREAFDGRGRRLNGRWLDGMSNGCGCSDPRLCLCSSHVKNATKIAMMMNPPTAAAAIMAPWDIGCEFVS